MGQYVALLRGINVGGNNLIKMADLKACFEKHNFRDVTTYIQSGNVLFTAPGSDSSKLTRRIEKLLSDAFGYDASLVLRSTREMQSVVKGAPRGFGKEPAKYRYDVLFLKETVDPRAAVEQLPTKEGVDAVAAGPGAFYFSRLISKATQSRMSRIASMPIYKSMTIRNWNTTTKLLRMMEERE